MAHLTFSKDVLIITDKSRTAGIIEDGVTFGSGAVISGKYLELLENHFFCEGSITSPSVAKLVTSINPVALPKLQRQIAQNIDNLTCLYPCFTIQELPIELGVIKKERNRNEGSIHINGVEVFKPSGELVSRQIGNHNVYFVVSDIDLRGKIRTVDDFSGIHFTLKGPRMVTQADGCGVCGTCGVCALCIICAEINAGVAVGAIIAISNVSHAATVSYDPSVRFENMKKREELKPEIEALLNKLDIIQNTFKNN